MSKHRKFFSINVCTKCDNQLSSSEKYNTNGTCPYCGLHSMMSCDTYKITYQYKKVEGLPWYKEIFGDVYETVKVSSV